MVGLVRTSLMLNDTLGDLARTVPKFRDNSMYIEKIRGFLSHNADIVSGDRAIETTKQSPLVLSNVSFSYDKTKDSRILEDINITVNPGEKIAIVGHNGAGKTTLVNLILRLYDVTDGEIQYDGTNIKDYELKDYRNMFGTVFQDYELFATSIANNVVMDADGVNHSDEVIAVLKKSGFGQKLEALEHGINTELTKEFDSKGTELSGGESQKIAIARALYKNSKILILDEPSSALDPISEYHFNKTMTESLEDKTIIFISHRLSTTKMADKIFLLENGKIIEQGNHDTLMKLNGQYARMFNLQAERYRTNAK
ncbi:atp-dependent permease mdl1 mitochondrial [Holotrichia oblita]|nr:atp-dependent permease mdl1 mitochondrial [Holotrichia oblita]